MYEQRGMKKQQTLSLDGVGTANDAASIHFLGKLTKTLSQNCGEPMEIH